jgi:hypothetical protein
MYLVRLLSRSSVRPCDATPSCHNPNRPFLHHYHAPHHHHTPSSPSQPCPSSPSDPFLTPTHTSTLSASTLRAHSPTTHGTWGGTNIAWSVTLGAGRLCARGEQGVVNVRVREDEGWWEGGNSLEDRGCSRIHGHLHCPGRRATVTPMCSRTQCHRRRYHGRHLPMSSALRRPTYSRWRHFIGYQQRKSWKRK